VRGVETDEVEIGQEVAIGVGRTESTGERLLANTDDVDISIARPSIIESSVEYPHPGWIEGVNTSGPLSYLIYRGHRFIPTQENLRLDIIPVDYVSRSLVAISAALTRGRHHDVYHLGSSDLNPVESHRMVELTQLASRRIADHDQRVSGPEKLLIKGADSVPVKPQTFENFSAPRVRQATEGLQGLLDKVPTDQMGGLGEAVDAVKGIVDTAHKAALTTEKFFEVFFPFVAGNKFIFRSQNYGELIETVSAAEQQRYRAHIRDLDWRDYWMNIHMPALAEYIFPQIDARLKRSSRDVYTYDDLVELFDASTRHFEDRVAMQHHHGGIVERYTYGDLRDRAARAAQNLLAAGVREDVPVLLASENRPQWGMAYFGILEADGIAVPVDPDSTVDDFVNFIRSSHARAVVLSDDVADRVREKLETRLRDCRRQS
ncbi:MAG: AMP-binding protein, partial [Bradymonadaceae bacterium]